MKEDLSNQVCCPRCNHKNAMPDGVKCRKCNPNLRNNFEEKIVKVKVKQK